MDNGFSKSEVLYRTRLKTGKSSQAISRSGVKCGLLSLAFAQVEQQLRKPKFLTFGTASFRPMEKPRVACRCVSYMNKEEQNMNTSEVE